MPRYHADPSEAVRSVEVEGLTLLYHRPSGTTHVLAPPAPQILEMLREEPGGIADLQARMSARYVLAGGGLSYEASYMPHGETYATWREASTRELRPERVCDDATAFMFHIGAPLYLTRWALRGEGAAALHAVEGEDAQWDDVRAHFLDHLDEVDADLRAAGLPSLGREGNGELN